MEWEMNDASGKSISEARNCLIKAAGWSTRDFGMGRIVGEVFAYIYLSSEPASLDEVSRNLELSKAAVSIATRQLDKLSLINRVKTPGDRRTYYKTSDHFAASLQKGVLELLRSKLKATLSVLDQAEGLLTDADGDEKEIEFLKERITRARKIRGRVDKLLNNPLMKLIR
jgi:DNA-binding transcriptional regulator GbsR (MarR family)